MEKITGEALKTSTSTLLVPVGCLLYRLQVPIFLTKAIELYEMICVRHGLMVVGPTGGGKSKNIAVLKEALTHLKVGGHSYDACVAEMYSPDYMCS